MTVIINILLSIGMKLFTEQFICKILLIALKKISASTENKIDDEIVKAVEDAVK